ncbi:MAG: hypothetical protein M3Y59_13115 [Myxococcota bacterium]|nr:hypothetical protein [Myxococcota bacterium]
MSQMNALGAIGGLDPLALGIDLGGQLLGLPPEIRNAAKIVAGVISGDLICAANGAVGLMGNLQEGGTVEWHAGSSSSTTVGLGYASQSQTRNTPSGSSRQDSLEVSLKYQQSDAASRSSGKPGEGSSSSSSSATTAELSLRAAHSLARSGGGISQRSSQEVKLRMNSAESTSSGGTTRGMKQTPAGGAEGAGTTEPSATPSATPKDKGLKPEFEFQLYDSIRVVWENYGEVESGIAGFEDGLITVGDLEAVIADADSSPELVEAARFIIKNFERAQQMLIAYGGAGLQSSWAEAVYYARDAGILPKESPQAGAGAGGGSSGINLPAMADPERQERIRQILANDKIGSSDRLIGVASELLGGIDGQVNALTNQLSEVPEADMQGLLIKIQQLTNLRSQMHSLISQIMQNENEMAMRCINNL